MTKKCCSAWEFKPYPLGFLQVVDERWEGKWKEVVTLLTLHFHRKSLFASFALSETGWNGVGVSWPARFLALIHLSLKIPSYQKLAARQGGPFCFSPSVSSESIRVFTLCQISDRVKSKHQQSQVWPPNPPEQCFFSNSCPCLVFVVHSHSLEMQLTLHCFNKWYQCHASCV